jgi:hypothetical protein
MWGQFHPVRVSTPPATSARRAAKIKKSADLVSNSNLSDTKEAFKAFGLLVEGFYENLKSQPGDMEAYMALVWELNPEDRDAMHLVVKDACGRALRVIAQHHVDVEALGKILGETALKLVRTAKPDFSAISWAAFKAIVVLGLAMEAKESRERK